jgi:Rps23 Pro-64 3,4-dihydroxylase Tpa1-like proline 4-hydroxylase
MATASLYDPYACLRPTQSAAAPFRYFLSERCLIPETEATVLDWLEREAPWKLVVADFYEQFEFDMRDAELPNELTPLLAPEMLARLCLKMEGALGDPLGPEVQVAAHRLDPGQRIAIHNDMRQGGETHRLTVQLNRGLRDEDGGFFMLFSSDDPSDIHRILRPISGSAIGFAISPDSHHAVSRLHGGVRFTLVYSFNAA